MNLSTYLIEDRTIWRSMSFSRDPFWYIVASIISILFALLSYKAADIGNATIIARTMTVLSGTLLGFLITSLSILLAISDRKFIQSIRKSGHINNLVNQVFLVALILILSIAMSIFSLISTYNALTPITVGLTIFALVVFCRIGYKYKQIFYFLNNE